MDELVSVIIPAFNAAQTISRCLHSVINQDYIKLEIIVINDGSTDDTKELIEQFAQKDSRIRCISQENGGLSAARNAGLLVANGKFVQFVDADDYITTDATSHLVSLMQNDTDLAIAEFIRTQEPGEPKLRIPVNTVPFSGQITKYDLIKEYLYFLHYNGYACNKLFRTSLMKRHNLFFNSGVTVLEDLVFSLEYLQHAKLVTLSQKQFYYYTDGEGTLSTSYHTDWENISRLIVGLSRSLVESLEARSLSTEIAINDRILSFGIWGISISAHQDNPLHWRDQLREIKRITQCQELISAATDYQSPPKESRVKYRSIFRALILLRAALPLWAIVKLRTLIRRMKTGVLRT